MCEPDVLFHQVVARWPGSVNDSRISENNLLYSKLEQNQIPMYHLLSDAEYALKRFVMTQVSAPRDPQERAYNNSNCKTRKVIERGFGILKRRFGYWCMKLRTHLDITKAIIVARVVMHNIGIKNNLIMPYDREDGNQNDIHNRYR